MSDRNLWRVPGQTALVLGLCALLVAVPAAAQQTVQRARDCHTYRVDEGKSRIYFNNPKIYIIIPNKAERDRLRSQGVPAQLFVMKDCSTPEESAVIKVYAEPAAPEASPSEEIFSATPVLVLAEQGDWVQIKGRTKMWMGKGWVRLDEKTILVKY